MSILYDWLSTMGKIIVKPSRTTFLDEAKKAKGKSSSAYFLLVVLYFLFELFLRTLFVVQPERSLYSIIIMGLVLPIAFFFYVFCVTVIYKRLFRRRKDYLEELLYLLCAIFFVICIFLLVAYLIPYGEYLGLALLGYMFYLSVLTLKTLTNLKPWQASMTIILAMFLGIPGILCIPAFILNVSDAVPVFFGG